MKNIKKYVFRNRRLSEWFAFSKKEKEKQVIVDAPCEACECDPCDCNWGIE